MAIKEFDSELVSRVSSVVSNTKPAEVNTNLLEGLSTQVKAVLGGPVNEEKDPDDNKTGDLFGQDEPKLKQIHHKVTMYIHHGDVLLGSHVVGRKTYNRKPGEHANDFKNRVMRQVENGHSSYDEIHEKEHDHIAIGPYNNFDELAQEEGTHSKRGSPQWMHAGSTGSVHHTHGDGKGLNIHFDHHLAVGHEKL